MTLIGIDFGSRRVGIASSDSHVLATPHSVIGNAGTRDELIERIVRLGEELGATGYVLGVPRRAGRHDEVIEKKFEAIAELLRQKSCKDVVLWDENLSTVEAYARAASRGVSSRTLKNNIDMQAAAVILQSYLDHQAGRTS
ncbi:MAG TPA: Holliday junction resolvase RuvX [Thermoanaerobaculia bacterium]|nr:Holliday junction resolvase RuvX [Thermoanaerobaculia bacterium]